MDPFLQIKIYIKALRVLKILEVLKVETQAHIDIHCFF